MKLSILTENVAGGKFLAEHGLSYLIEIDDQKILFDTGHSDVFLQNACKMGVDIEKEVETIVLSHGHWDHGDGLTYLKNKRLIAHDNVFISRFRKADSTSIGLSLSRTELDNRFQVITTKAPFRLTEHLIFLGEIPRENHFEAKITPFTDDSGDDDFVPDDSALAAVCNQQLVIVTGCSHSGICNITDYAVKLTGITRIKAVLGGFHLKQQDRQTMETISYFKAKGVEQVCPSHCTGLPAMAAFYDVFKNSLLKSGMRLDF